MDSGNRQKIVNISMDVEDVYGDQELLNNLLADLIDFFCENNIPCDLYITGVKLDLLVQYPQAFKKLHFPYVKCGFHSNTHSFKPIPCFTDEKEIAFSEEHYFNIENAKFDNEKTGGIMLFEKHFKNQIFRCPGLCWTPDYFSYISGRGYNYTTIDILYRAPFEFMGITILPTNERPLEAYSSFDELKKNMECYDVVSLYLHPSRLLYDAFWDKQAARSTYENATEKIEILKHILLSLKSDYTLISISEINKYYQTADDIIPFPDELLISSMTSKWTWSQLPKSFYSEYHISKLKYNLCSLKGMRAVCE